MWLGIVVSQSHMGIRELDKTMVKRMEGDTISVDEFAFAWRITDERWDKLSDELIRQLHILSPQRSREIDEMSRPLYHRGPYALRTENYAIQSRVSLVDLDSRDQERIRHWFARLPIASEEEVYVSWVGEPDTKLITAWGIFQHIWDSLWYPFDAVGIFDETLKWAILLGSEEIAVYGERL